MQISFGFFLLIGWFALANGLQMTLLILAVAALHELGHLLALWLFGAPVKGVQIGVFGAVLEADTSRLSYAKELVAVLAGPMTNLLAAVGGRCIGAEDLFIGVNLVLCFFNLMPVEPLDGGRALRLLLCWSLGVNRGEQFARAVGILSALCLAGILFCLMRESGGSLWLLPPMIGMLLLVRRGFSRKDENSLVFL